MATKRFLISASLMLLGLLASRSARALGNVNWDPTQGCYDLTWDGVDPSTDSAQVNYDVYFGFGTNPSNHVDQVSGLTYRLCPSIWNSTYPSYGNYSFLVVSTDSVSGTNITTLGHTFNFMRNYLRADENGEQVGHGQIWNVNLTMQSNAYMDVLIYPPFTTFTYDADNLVTGASAAPTKVLMSNTPRSGEEHGIFTNTFTWMSDDSSGTIVPNGIYWMLLSATADNGFGRSLRDTALISIPVDIMRIIDLSATGITASASQATINYILSADSLVTVVIAKPGSKFTIASSSGSVSFLSGAETYTYQEGFPVTLNTAGTAIDGSNILRVFQYNRERGTHTETWNGTNQLSAALAKGIYAYAISATDDFNNHAIDLTGNDGPLAGTIPIDTTSPSSGGGGGTSDFTAPTISAFSPSSGTTVTSALSAVSAVLTDNAGGAGVDGTASTIVLTDSVGNTLAGTRSFDSASGRLTLTLTAPLGLSNNGVYTVTVTAVDSASPPNTSVATSIPFTLSIVDPNVFVSGTNVYAFPNPAPGSTGSVNIAFTTNRSLPMTFQVFNVLGELVFNESFASSSGAQNRAWNLSNPSGEKIVPGVYIYRLKGSDASGTAEIVKKLVIVP